MKTKYIKVSTADRLPDESDYFNTDDGWVQFNIHDKKFWLEGVYEVHPKYWLEEVNDYEDEMMELLTELTEAIEFESIIIKENIDNDGWENFGGRLYDKAKNLLTKIKES
ncbi:hypothetical protein [Chryseobacterium sp. JV274]|uniref:hypothetical protein n=1 Tax=Chryseobacterium sp. JV274 TaxID=1932669 RepID=UPI0015C2BB4B|nr:hypothetical protein [Chryseobacterium sp. JV274]CAD0220380.1 conserved protein of unknown function [Chryseobacterium sp. JV274]